jgi:predicted Zn-dependent protease
MLAIDRHNLDLSRQLVQRTKDDPTLAERAATSLIEAAPNEAENHQALAEVRESQNRWPDAVAHWERVAELRSLEPTGLLKLSAALIHEQQFDRAKATLNRVLGTEWPERFSNAHNEARELLRRIPN